jgi:hypothetical protein
MPKWRDARLQLTTRFARATDDVVNPEKVATGKLTSASNGQAFVRGKVNEQTPGLVASRREFELPQAVKGPRFSHQFSPHSSRSLRSEQSGQG